MGSKVKNSSTGTKIVDAKRERAGKGGGVEQGGSDNNSHNQKQTKAAFRTF